MASSMVCHAPALACLYDGRDLIGLILTNQIAHRIIGKKHLKSRHSAMTVLFADQLLRNNAFQYGCQLDTDLLLLV